MVDFRNPAGRRENVPWHPEASRENDAPRNCAGHVRRKPDESPIAECLESEPEPSAPQRGLALYNLKSTGTPRDRLMLLRKPALRATANSDWGLGMS